MRSLRGLRRCREAKRAPRSKERCVARERQVTGKEPSGWGGDTYPGDARTRSPPSTKRKLSSQDSNGQPGEPRIAHSALAIQKVNLLRGERRVIRRAPRIQEGAEQSGEQQAASGASIIWKGPSCPEDHQATKGAPIGLETIKRLSRRRVARKEPREQKRAIKSKTGAEYHGLPDLRGH